jgi:putative transposase
LKKGKQKNRSKRFRKAIAPWAYRQVMTRIPMLAQENRVRLVAVNPRDTSRTCPHCGSVARENRRGENFRCISCNYSADADHVGALNVLAKTLGNSQERMVPESFCVTS